jgi:hypothetical protein
MRASPGFLVLLDGMLLIPATAFANVERAKVANSSGYLMLEVLSDGVIHSSRRLAKARLRIIRSTSRRWWRRPTTTAYRERPWRWALVRRWCRPPSTGACRARFASCGGY